MTICLRACMYVLFVGFVCVCIGLFAGLQVWWYVCLCMYVCMLSVCLFARVCVCLFACKSLAVRLYVCMYVREFVFLSVCSCFAAWLFV